MARHDASLQRAIDLFSDWRWRLNNLYWITDKEGRAVPFRMNWAQESLFDGMHYLNVVLKARQLGFSTFIAMYMLDVCVFNSHTAAGIIDAKIDDAKGKLGKISFAYERMPDGIKATVPIGTANAQMIEWRNGSSIKVGTSHRGGTLQLLHISELGKIAATQPQKAREIRTGALNTVQAGNQVFVESTAEGQQGDFYDICTLAQAKQRMGVKLTRLDFKFHFYAWHQAPEYEIDPEGVVISEQFARYFSELEGKGIKLRPGQKAWYVKKAETQLDDMKREYPSTPEEAFEASVEGAILGPWMEAAERAGKIGVFPAVPGVPVHSFWDIGRKDYTSIWFVQILPGKCRIVGFYQNVLSELPHYAEYLLGTAVVMKHMPDYLSRGLTQGIYANKGWTQGNAYLPHDGKVKEWGAGRTRVEQAIKFGLKAKLAALQEKHDQINASRTTIPMCEFDREGCEPAGLKVLKSYRWEWDDKLGAWKTGTPAHDDNSHGSDAFHVFSTTWREMVPEAEPARPKPTDLIIHANADGSYNMNMSVKEIAEMNRRKRLAND
jgi:hypothetical protein